ncbi:DNAJC11 family DNAJ domain-containing protein [Schizosaccharomyces cryophilus OY26]|uniref:DNAJC11 family DNAJ domain-containing protein n=1 Tax=Schizosaccharomyces cryophilus (strain OY26 / ATCC MYA-4695 / CBS 11777 / NBRC 106824 / NRRL Y48691) TaxID=653667 RepID=S9WYJ4_SCHCR|nr:DNAJC11 family DNAJ domain-containing protein [Schizosaccharomyces cryophilus OY26]EPY49812.1 DNAJC11 family DNAJ domain-containing protein [Schizosaccharomyces cryophilus OY26]
MEEAKELYEVLGLPIDATPAQIKDAYYRLSKLFHPDRHNVEQKLTAEQKFQSVQAAYEVLSDPIKRQIYDKYGTKGLKVEWDVGPAGQSTEELQEAIREQLQAKESQNLDLLVQNRTETNVMINATPLFAKNLRVRNPLALGMASTRELTLLERFSLVQWVSFHLKNSFSIPLSTSKNSKFPIPNFFQGSSKDDDFSDPLEDNESINGSTRLIFITEASAKPGARTQPSLSAVIRHQPSARLSTETGLSILRPGIATVKAIYALNNETFVIPMIRVSSYKRPPQATVVIGRQISRYGTLSVRWKTGSWSLGSWGAAYPSNNASSFSIIWQQLKPSLDDPFPVLKWNAELTAGLLYSGVGYNYNIDTLGPYQLQCGTSLSTVGGLQVTADANRKVFRHSAMGLTVAIGLPSGALTLNISWSRLGQKFSFPIMWSSALDRSSAFWGLALPIGSILGVDYLFLRPRRISEEKRKRALRLQQHKKLHDTKKEAAEQIVSLMRELVQKKQKMEAEKGGLIIEYAEYRTIPRKSALTKRKEGVIKQDVTIPIASLVDDSRLVIPSSVSKSSIIGIYPLFSDADKELLIVYKFHQQSHHVLLRDKQGVLLPNREHKLL